MIQRKQTIWLLLAAITGFLLTRVPLYTANLGGETIKRFMASEHLLLFAVAIVSAILALVSIFLFKNRALQTKLSVVGLLLSIGFVALEVWKLDDFKEANLALKSTYSLGALLPLLMIVFFFLAIRNIRKDEKLVKSLDRLR